MKRLFRPLLAVALAVASLGLPSTAFAVSIVVVVNGQPITDYAIQQRVALMRISGQEASTSAATDQLIDEALQLQEAETRGVTVAASQVESAFSSIAQQVNLSVSQFNQALRESGVEPETLRTRLRAQIAWSGVMQSLVQNSATVRQEDITAQLIARGGEVSTVQEFLLQPIVFVIPAGSSNSTIEQRRSQAESYRRNFAGCDSAIQQAQGIRDVAVLDIIRRDSSQLTDEAVLSTPVGGTTAPQRTEDGYQLIAVCAITEVQANEAARNEIANELMLEQGEQVGQDFLAELRQSAVIQRF